MSKKVILNYWSKGRINDVLVGIGDVVVSATDEFNLTKGKKYKINGIYSINEIYVVNDLGIEEIYTVEHFRK